MRLLINNWDRAPDNNDLYDDRSRKYGQGSATFIVYFSRTNRLAMIQIVDTTDVELRFRYKFVEGAW